LPCRRGCLDLNERKHIPQRLCNNGDQSRENNWPGTVFACLKVPFGSAFSLRLALLYRVATITILGFLQVCRAFISGIP
jgi:hypothetical protein